MPSALATGTPACSFCSVPLSAIDCSFSSVLVIIFANPNLSFCGSVPPFSFCSRSSDTGTVATGGRSPEPVGKKANSFEVSLIS